MVESTQIRWFFRLSGGGGWSGRAVAQWRPKVSKLGLKGLSDCHSNETTVEAARGEASGPNKRATLKTFLLKRGELKISSKLAWKMTKGRLPDTSTTDKKKQLLTLALGDVEYGRR